MNTNKADIKNSLHKLVVETDDENVLNKVHAFFTTLRSKNVDWWDIISIQEKKDIEIGLKQLDNGEGIPHKEVKKKANKLLNRK